MISATQMRPGMVIIFNKELHSVFSVTHRTPGNLRGFVQAKMRNLRSGSMFEHRFSSEDRVEKANLEEHEMEYLYDDGDYFYFMNTESYEQMHLTKEILGDAPQYLIPQYLIPQGRPSRTSSGRRTRRLSSPTWRRHGGSGWTCSASWSPPRTRTRSTCGATTS